jgi:CBS domain-containing protein
VIALMANQTQRPRRAGTETAMRIKDIMTPEPRVAQLNATAAEAAALMMDGDCGILPVVDEGQLVGVVTDRDLFIALATRNTRACDLVLGEVAQRTVHTCAPDDDVQEALQTMRRYRIRRLPVTGFGDRVVGIVSMNDIVLAAGASEGIRPADAMQALQAICAHHRPVPHIQPA